MSPYTEHVECISQQYAGWQQHEIGDEVERVRKVTFVESANNGQDSLWEIVPPATENWKQSSSRAAYIFHVSFSPVSHYKINSLSSSNWLPYSGKLSREKTHELGFLPRKFSAIRYSFTSEC